MESLHPAIVILVMESSLILSTMLVVKIVELINKGT